MNLEEQVLEVEKVNVSILDLAEQRIIIKSGISDLSKASTVIQGNRMVRNPHTPRNAIYKTHASLRVLERKINTHRNTGS
jgi:hypothetical protein